MTDTLATSAAVLKRRYDDSGRFPKAQYQKFPAFASLPKEENWDGDDLAIAFQIEDNQGGSSDFATALGSLQAADYRRFLPQRVEYFWIARVRGHALRAAAKSSGSFVNVWTNALAGSERMIMKMWEIYSFGNGSGALGAANFSTVTATLTTTSQIVNFDLGARYGGQSANTLSPTVRSGYIKVTGIDRGAGTLTAATNWTTDIVGLTNGDFLARAGDSASGGTAKVPIGRTAWVEGGSSPAALWSLTRTTDPVRMAGQNYNATGQTMNDALTEAEGLVQVQGYDLGKRAWGNPRDMADWKKTLAGKVTYDKVDGSTSVAGVSFKAIQYDGVSGPVEFRTSPWCPRNQVFIEDPSMFVCASLGPAPHLARDDGMEAVRVANDDAIEARHRVFGNFLHRGPSGSIRITNWGA